VFTIASDVEALTGAEKADLDPVLSLSGLPVSPPLAAGSLPSRTGCGTPSPDLSRPPSDDWRKDMLWVAVILLVGQAGGRHRIVLQLERTSVSG
jgi:hypothetical protein